MSRWPARPAAALAALALLVPLGLGGGPADAVRPAESRTTPPAAAAPLPTGATASAATPTARASRRITLFTLSNRPDLISGGDARVVIKPIPGLSLERVRVRVDGRDVTERFARRTGGRFEAYLTGLRLGRNVITATAPGGRSGRLVVTNHPEGGPVFSGPQLRHYRCQEGARDAQCNQPPTYRFLYRSTNPLLAALQPYDPADPPADVATTTTDEGITMPFVVRQEEGFQDRDRYTILALWQPGRPWSRFDPQRQFNHKLLITHGGGCGASYTPGDPPLADFSGTFPEQTPGVTASYITALGQGFGVLSTALDNTGHNCNVAMQAESLMMAKERFVEQYGTLRYTIGTGCSGGSIAQQTVANAYPGIYQGLLTTCTYPDTLTAGAQFFDYHLMRLYFEDPAAWAPGVIWTPTQMAAVEGHVATVNSVVADEGLFKAALNPEHDCPGTLPPVAGDRSTRYDSDINPGGVRCSVLDIAANLLGTRPREVWGSQEKAAGRGFGGIPIANAGIQYGLEQLRSGEITAAQFVDLNTQVGGLDVDSAPTAARTPGDARSVANAYRTGLINEADHLDQVAIINFGGPDPGIAHDYAHAFWVEDRMHRVQGHTDNRVMWFGATPLIGDLRWANESLEAMDRWLAAVERDDSRLPLSAKIVRDKPADLTDRCANAPGILEVPGEDDEVDCVLPESLQLRLSTPREQAGGDRLNDIVSCRLTPLARSDFDFLLVPLSDEQWTQLRGAFPTGVCDYGRRGVGQRPAQTWLTYGEGPLDRLRVVPGGRNLPAVTPHQADGWAAPSFRSLVRQ